MGIARRLFVFDFNNLDKALRQFKDSLMEKDDYYLCIKRDDIKINNNVETALKVLLSKGEGEVKDTKELPDASYNAFVIATICSKINKKTNVYFVACPEIYDFTRKHIEGKAGFICQKATLACIKHNDFVDVDEEKNEKINQPNNKNENNKEENGNFKASYKEHFHSNKEHTDTKTQINNDKNEKQNSQNIDSGLGDVLNDMHTNTPHYFNSNKHNGASARAPDNNINNKSQTSVNKKEKIPKKQPDVVEVDEDIRSIEKKIFFSAKVDEVHEREYSEIDDDKFRILTSTFERFKKHMSLQIKNEDDLNDEDYEQIIIYLIKSDDLNDFNNSKNIAKLKADIDMDSDTYNIFKNEAQYYIKMCDLFYKEDKW